MFDFGAAEGEDPVTWEALAVLETSRVAENRHTKLSGAPFAGHVRDGRPSKLACEAQKKHGPRGRRVKGKPETHQFRPTRQGSRMAA